MKSTTIEHIALFASINIRLAMPKNRLFPTCKEAQSLLSEAQDHHLSLFQRTRVRTHVWMCIDCVQFSKQLDFLREAMRRLGKD